MQLLFPQLFCGLDDSPAWCDTDSKVLLQTDPAMETGTAVMLFAEPLALSALLLICTAFLVDGSFNPFLYFRF